MNKKNQIDIKNDKIDYDKTEEEKTEIDYITELNALSKDIIRLAINTILVKLRFMDASMSALKPEISYDAHIATNGVHWYFNPKVVLDLYKYEQNAVQAAYMHSLLHCVFKHFYVNPELDQKLWDLACDIAVEATICDIDEPSLQTKRRARQKEFIADLKSEIRILSAEKIYAYYLEKNLDDETIYSIHRDFIVDEHKLWYVKNSIVDDENSRDTVDVEDENSTNLDDKQFSENNDEESSDDSESTNESNQGDENSEGAESSDSSETDESKNSNTEDDVPEDDMSDDEMTEEEIKDLLDKWSKIAKRMQTDLETRSKNVGDIAGDMMKSLRVLNRDRYDYTKFLNKFMSINEVMKLNLDEFDYAFYTYGLKILKKTPLVEPLEYKETRIIRDFVIAIDTSGSVRGELVQKFIEKTYNILKQKESFTKKIHLHILQADSVIQEEAIITNQDEFDEYIENLELKGFGGTDFRPVFEHVNHLVKSKELRNLKGLIYFTDGLGIFPETKPDYSTAFVFVEDDFEYEEREVPVWAIKLVLQSDEI